MNRFFVWGLALLFVGCESDRSAPVANDLGVDAASDAGSLVDAGSPVDSSSLVDAAYTDAGNCGATLVAPTTRLTPQVGELFYAQIGLNISMGEAALLIGPDGRVVLIDVANNSHDDNIEDLLSEITGSAHVDDIVITHFHADHADGISDLLERITLTGHIVYRGFTDLTAAANTATINELCAVLESRASADAPLCTAATRAPCSTAARSGSYPALACDGLATADIALGAGARLDFMAVNGFIGGDNYATLEHSIDASDSNGENARSVVGLIEHGAFRMLVAGDLTGGGSDTDDLESFYATRLEAQGVPAAGIDVLHAGHHGRNTSTNGNWVARLLPNDGRSRNAVMGISDLHLNSPHPEVLSALLDGNRLNEGRAWTTTVAAGSTHTNLVDANGGHILIATRDGGSTYVVQAISQSGALIESRAFHSVGACR